MAQTLQSKEDNWGFSFGEEGQALATATTQRIGLVVGGVTDDATNVFQRLPIGTSSAGTAVQVNLIGTEPVVVEIGTVTIGTLTSLGTLVGAGTLTALGSITQGSITSLGSIVQGSVTSVGTIVGLGSVAGLGTITNLGSVTNIGMLHGGTVDMLTAGTVSMINAGTLTSLGTVPGIGSISAVAQVHNAGTIAGLPDLPGGTIDMLTAGTVSMINAGTITSVGSVPGIGSISAIAQVHNAGTIQAGTIGTVAAIGQVHNAGTVAMLTAGTVTRVEQGSINVTAGTIGAATVTGGSIVVTAGTLSAGTIDAGTIKDDGRPARNIVSYGTTFAATAAAYATLVGSASVGAGTSLWVNDLSIVNTNGTVTCLVGFGTATSGSNVLAKGNFGPQGGIEKPYPLAVNAGMTNQDLVVYVGAAGTIDITVSYFIST